MKKIAIVTDSNSGITQSQAAKLGVHVVPMPFYINEELYFEDITLTKEEFYQKLEEDAEISTSQPSPASVLELWDELLKEYEQIVYIPMSSGLSASCETAMALARDYEEKVFVVDNQRISVTLKQSVMDALLLVQRGMDGAQIKETLEAHKMESSIYLTLDTLKYLKKGGRITPAAAAFGSILNLKPILQIQGEKLDAFGKARGKIKAKKIMLDAIKKDLEERFAEPLKNGELVMDIVCGSNMAELEEWEEEVKKEFPGMEFHKDTLSLSVACHIGPSILAIACTRKLV